jgi:hypothetical protein
MKNIRKTTAEECCIFTMTMAKKVLRRGHGAIQRVSWGGRGGLFPTSLIYFALNHLGGLALGITYTTENHDDWLTQQVNLDTSPTPLGERYWFLCPNKGCGRRCAKLYRPMRAEKFLCRHCYDLGYMSQQDRHASFYKALWRLQEIDQESLDPSTRLRKRLDLHEEYLSLQARIGRSRWPSATQTVRKFDCEITTTEELEREEARLTG